MASMTMASSFLSGSAAIAVTKQPSTATSRRGLVVMANASKVAGVEKVVVDEKKVGSSSNSGRRDMMFAVAAAAAFSVAKVALAGDEEPKRGTEAAKKKYGPVCVTMPTARICRN
ncbi:hypothetical protein L1987_67717 [Smallanthus sonchifolius]|uniref:Uncharacterized protein n=1 Tax=Smallanthus sonchifolius TaxID=185202 RepID=A0ACB9B7L5_9ASTR|nr:hypothetical protein L1987_67717 [Smallanthus sonchifolius]